MTTQILTNEIGIEEWHYKISKSDDEWLLQQYVGLSMIIGLMEKEIEEKFHEIKCENGNVSDDAYRGIIYPLENNRMDVEMQFVDVEDEMARRGIDVLGLEP